LADTALPFCDAMNVIAGEKLSSVTFVLDYWQLDFDSLGFSVYTWLSVHRDGKTVRSGASGFSFEYSPLILLTFSLQTKSLVYSKQGVDLNLRVVWRD
jgi:hypothetical protein